MEFYKKKIKINEKDMCIKQNYEIKYNHTSTLRSRKKIV